MIFLLQFVISNHHSLHDVTYAWVDSKSFENLLFKHRHSTNHGLTGSTTYPIASFTYLLLPKEMSTNPRLDERKAKALVDFISWAVTDGQKLAANLHYVPLPAVVVKHNQDTLKSLTFKGTPLYIGQQDWK